jgi:hypothetical protein
VGRAVAMATSWAATHEAGDARAKADRTKVEVFGPRLCGGKRWTSRQGRRLTSLGEGHLGSRVRFARCSAGSQESASPARLNEAYSRPRGIRHFPTASLGEMLRQIETGRPQSLDGVVGLARARQVVGR